MSLKSHYFVSKNYGQTRTIFVRRCLFRKPGFVTHGDMSAETHHSVCLRISYSLGNWLCVTNFSGSTHPMAQRPSRTSLRAGPSKADRRGNLLSDVLDCRVVRRGELLAMTQPDRSLETGRLPARKFGQAQLAWYSVFKCNLPEIGVKYEKNG
jgi:hypothetical protein